MFGITPVISAQERVAINVIFTKCFGCLKEEIMFSSGFSGEEMFALGCAGSTGIHQVRGRQSLHRRRNMRYRTRDPAETHSMCVTLFNS